MLLEAVSHGESSSVRTRSRFFLLGFMALLWSEVAPSDFDTRYLNNWATHGSV